MDKTLAMNEILKSSQPVDGLYQPTQISFTVFKTLIDSTGLDGFAVFDVGGDLNNWVCGLTGSMFNSKVVKSDNPSDVWWGLFVLTSDDDRQDLLMIFNLSDPEMVDMQALNNWRATKPKNCLISQYLTRCAPQFHKD